MKKRLTQTYPIVIVVVSFMMLLSSCSTPLDTADPKQSFTKIYNESSFSNAISAIDVVETDAGYLILAQKIVESEVYPNTLILAIDKEGKVVQQINIDSIYVCPTKGFFKYNDNFRFLCMNSNTLYANMLEIDKHGAFKENTPLTYTFNNQVYGMTYPLAVGIAKNGSYLVLGYSQENNSTVFANYSTTFSKVWSNNYSLPSTDEVDKIVINKVLNHLAFTGKRYPFYVGQSSTNYYFNGFNEDNFALAFLNLNGDFKQTGYLNGFQYDGGLSSIIPLDGDKFAISRFYFDENYIIPSTSIESDSILKRSQDIKGRRMLELEPDAEISLNRLTLSGKKVLIYASTTINKQMVLYVYDEATGNLINSKYFGLSIPLEFGSLIATQDGGLLLIGSAYVESRFKRISAIKLAKSQLDDLLK